jgi:2-isopropylmalate synthase
MRIYTLDSTLCEGVRGEGIFFSVDEKLLLAREIDEFGVDYLEAGWHAADRLDRRFFECARGAAFHHAKLVAAARLPAENTAHSRFFAALLESQAPAVSLYAGPGEPPAENARGAVRRLKEEGREVLFHAEDFFRHYYANHLAAMELLEAAKAGGADALVLCDSSGGMLPRQVAQVGHEVRRRFGGVLGIRAWNQADVAVANTLAAVELGFDLAGGVINGYGDACGAANLCSLLPNLELRLGHQTVGRDRLRELTRLAHMVAEIANLAVRPDQPFVGRQASAGAGHAVLRELSPEEERLAAELEAVGNHPRKVLLDSYARRHPEFRDAEDSLAQLEDLDQDLKAADGTLELLFHQTVNPHLRPFEVLDWEVSTRKPAGAAARSVAKVTVRAGDQVLSAREEGRGPVYALDACLRACLGKVYPEVLPLRLVDYKVRVLEPRKGVAAKVRVLIEWCDGGRDWVTVGVSEDVLEASWRALTDGVKLELLRQAARGDSAAFPSRDSSWAV